MNAASGGRLSLPMSLISTTFPAAMLSLLDSTTESAEEPVNGATGKDAAHGGLDRYARFMPQTGHNIPAVFVRYLEGMQADYGFDWSFVLGFPITEAYWTKMRVSGQDLAMLVQ